MANLPSKTGVVAIVPAAGMSLRFGSMKLLADVEGQPLVSCTLRSLLDAAVDRIIVVHAPVPFGDVDLFRDARVHLVTNPDPSRGMFSSIQTGLHSVDVSDDLVVVLPADMPFVKPATVEAVLSACRESGCPAAAAFKGRHGHPLVLPASLVPALCRADPRQSLKDALTALRSTPVSIDVPDGGVIRDVDTQEDLAHPG